MKKRADFVEEDKNQTYIFRVFLFSIKNLLDSRFFPMMAIGLRLEDRLDGAMNFAPWKARIVFILQGNELWDEVVNHTQTHTIVVPAAADVAAHTAFNKKDTKEKRIILDAIKDHIIRHLTTKMLIFYLRIVPISHFCLSH